jgi:pseudaminic acid biosynthesis-associated methylase
MTDTEQLDAWRGSFGDTYTNRNIADDAALAARTRMWARILDPLVGDEPKNILEIGANLGLNLRALKQLTDARLTAVEPNPSARERLVGDAVLPKDAIFDATAGDLPFTDEEFDLTFTSGVLIHIAPSDLAQACKEIHRVSLKHIMCCEYFSDKEEEIAYRGHSGLLFKRDFGNFWMTSHPDLTLLDYGFFWKRATGLDNLTWWLFRKG